MKSYPCSDAHHYFLPKQDTGTVAPFTKCSCGEYTSQMSIKLAGDAKVLEFSEAMLAWFKVVTGEDVTAIRPTDQV